MPTCNHIVIPVPPDTDTHAHLPTLSNAIAKKRQIPALSMDIGFGGLFTP